MKRILVIGVLCVLLLATAGAGVVTAQHGPNQGKGLNGAGRTACTSRGRGRGVGWSAGRGRGRGVGAGAGQLAVTLHASVVTNGEIDKATFSAVVTAGNPVRYVLVRSDNNAVLYDGNNPNLGGAYVTYVYGTTPPTVTLAAYDNAGNTCTSSWPQA